MKKIFKLILLIITFKMNSQDKLKDILLKLEVNNRNYSLCFDSSNLRDVRAINEFNSLQFYRDDVKFILFKINEFKNYSVYAILTEDKIKLSNLDSLIYFNNLLFYDSHENRIFLLEYGFDGFPLKKISNNSYQLTIKLTKNLSRFIEFNQKIEPLSCVNFEYLKGDNFVYSLDLYKISDISCLVEKEVLDNKIYFNEYIYLKKINQNLKMNVINCSLNDNNIFYSFK